MRLSRRTTTVVYAVLIALSISMIYPFLYLIMNAFKSNTEYLSNTNGPPITWTLETMRAAIADSNLIQGAVNSALVVSASVIGVALLSSMAGYALAKTAFAGHRIVFFVIISGFMIPFQVILVPLYEQMAHAGLIDTYRVLVGLYITTSCPFGVFLMRSFYQGIPDELMEAAQIDGYTFNAIFWRIMLPIARPAIFTLSALTFIGLWNDLLIALVFTQSDSKRTMTVDVSNLIGRFVTNYPEVFAGLLLSTIPTIGFFLAFQGYLTKGLTMGINK